MRIGIFGGCFNPPHIMHKNLPLELISNDLVDKVIYVPAGNKYNKPGLASDKDRYNMLSILISNQPNLEISDYEFKNELTYTYQTMDYFRGKYPNDELYFICGADNLEEFDTWREYEYIMNNYKIVATSRNNIDLNGLLDKYDRFRDNIIITDIKSKSISSTIIREKLKNGDENLTEYLDLDVIDYIKDHNLY